METPFLMLAIALSAAAGAALTWLSLRSSRGRVGAKTETRTTDIAARRRLELLGAILEHAPTAVVLYGNLGEVEFSNPAARELLAEGASLDGLNFLDLLASAPAALREAALA